MKPALAALILLQCAAASAQVNASYRIDFLPVGALGRFTTDSLVAPGRHGKLSATGDVQVSAGYTFGTKNPALSFTAGIGYSQKQLVMNKRNAFDFLVAVLAFGGFRNDTFAVAKVRLHNKYVSVPVALNYCLTKNLRHRVRFGTGLQVNGSFLVKKEALLEFDPSAAAPTVDQAREMQERYRQTAARFVMGFYPQLDMYIRVHKGFGVVGGLQPLYFYLTSTSPRLTSGGPGFASRLGIYFTP